MGLALFKERRISNRRKLTGLLPGRLLHVGDGSTINCRPIDVSVNGMGMVTSRRLEPGCELRLMVADAAVLLQVAWVQADFSKQDMFRYGLVTTDTSLDLEAIFVQAGCIR